MRLVCILLVAAGCSHEPGPVRLPERRRPTVLVPDPRDAVTVSLTARGSILVEGERTLGSLVAYLRAHARSGAVARLRVDRGARWIHVQWVLRALAEAGIEEARFVYGGGEETDLPCRIEPADRAASEMVLKMNVVVSDAGQIRCGSLRTHLTALTSLWIRDARERVERERLHGLVAELLPADEAEWYDVAFLFQQFAEAGAAIRLRRFAAAPAAARTHAPMPRPTDPLVIGGDGGIEVAPARGGFHYEPVR